MKKLLVILMLLISNVCFSQVNIETIRNKNKDKSIWGEVKGGLELQRGNVDITSFDSDILIHFKKINTIHSYKQNHRKENSQAIHLKTTLLLI